MSRLSHQAEKYVDAIQLTVLAAYSGFTVTEDVLYLSTAIQDTIEDKEDLERYIMGMLALATQSRENSNKALEAFRDIRKELIGVRLDNCYPNQCLIYGRSKTAVFHCERTSTSLGVKVRNQVFSLRSTGLMLSQIQPILHALICVKPSRRISRLSLSSPNTYQRSPNGGTG